MNENVRQSVFHIALPVTAILAAWFFATAPARAASISDTAQTQPAQAKEYPYYIEFRVAVDGVYGHTYITYGRLDSLGRPITAAYADIHPIGDFPSIVLGHFFPMKAATVTEKETRGYKLASRFRWLLTVAEYDRLGSVIARIRGAHHSWSVLAYNCNDFVADVARGMGMQTPTTLSLPYDFIPKLKALNEQILHPAPMLTSAPVKEVRQSGQSTLK